MTDHPGRQPWFPPLGFGAVPVGSVVAFAGTLGQPDTSPMSPPAPAVGTTWPLEAWGWTLCDGRTLSATNFPELFAALGYLYGGSADSFALPDYRGYFLRGIDPAGKIDPDVSQRTAAPGGQQGGVGSTQKFALQTHSHDYVEATASSPGGTGSDAALPGQSVPTQGDPVTKPGASVPLQVSQNETRPINIYVNFIIKFTGLLWPTFDDPGERRMQHGL
jgi:microcystin-dependent protein